MVFYYWPTSYSVANANIANMKIPTGLVNMTGFVSAYGAGAGTNIPEFNPISITPSLGPPAFWEPSLGSSTWDGTTLCWSASSGQQVSLANDVSSSNAIFDDTGLVNGSTMNIVGTQNATSITVSNSGGTYTFSGSGAINALSLNKIGSGTLLLNTTVQAPVSVSAGTLGGNGSIGPLSVGAGGTVTPGATVSTPGQLTINGNADFSPGGTYLWKLGPSLVANSSGTSAASTGTAGTDWDVLDLAGLGSINFSGGAQLALCFATSAESPNNGGSFWNSNHTWVIADSGASVPAVGGSIVYNTTAGTFSLQGDLSNDLVLKFTSSGEAPRNLLWSAAGTNGANDGGGAWGNATWTDGTTAGLSFDSSRPDNVTFGNAGAASKGSAATVTISSAITVGSLAFNGGNSSPYTISGSGSLTIDGGVTAQQSTTLSNGASTVIVLGGSQTWNVASGALTLKGPIIQSVVSSLTKTGSGTLTLWSSKSTYSGGTYLNGGEINIKGSYALPQNGALTMAANTLVETNGNPLTIGALAGSGSIDIGTLGVAGLTFGDASNQTYSGVIYGGPAPVAALVTYQGSGIMTLAGANTFTGAIAINGGGEVQIAADNNLGNSSNAITLDNASAQGATASLSSSRNITIGPYGGSLYLSGSATVATFSGQITGGTLTVNNPDPAPNSPPSGTLVLTNSANSYAATQFSSGTLSIASSGAVSGPITCLGLTDGSTLQFAVAMTMPNDINLPVIGKKAIWFDTQGNNVTLTGQIIPATSTYDSVAIDKTGSGTLNFAAGDTTGLGGTKGLVYVHQGTIELSGAVAGYPAINTAAPGDLPDMPTSTPARPGNSRTCSWATRARKGPPALPANWGRSISPPRPPAPHSWAAAPPATSTGTSKCG